MKTITRIVILIVVVTLLMSVLPAAAIETPNSIIDPFIVLKRATNTDPNVLSETWWTTLHSSIPGLRAENVSCAGSGNPYANCAFIKTDPQTKDRMLHMEIQPDSSPTASFWFVQVTDKRDAYSANTPMKWKPENGGSVTYEVRTRFSDNYNVNATAGANGTVSLGLWNMPTYLFEWAPGQYGIGLNPIKGIWLSYTQAGNAGGSLVGVHTDILDQDDPSFGPTYTDPIQSGLNMSDWFTLVIKWEADHNGNQKVTFTIVQVSSGYYYSKVYNLPRPLPAMAGLLGMDSTLVGANGYPTVSAPTETQFVDVNNIIIHK